MALPSFCRIARPVALATNYLVNSNVGWVPYHLFQLRSSLGHPSPLPMVDTYGLALRCELDDRFEEDVLCYDDRVLAAIAADALLSRAHAFTAEQRYQINQRSQQELLRLSHEFGVVPNDSAVRISLESLVRRASRSRLTRAQVSSMLVLWTSGESPRFQKVLSFVPYQLVQGMIMSVEWHSAAFRCLMGPIGALWGTSCIVQAQAALEKTSWAHRDRLSLSRALRTSETLIFRARYRRGAFRTCLCVNSVRNAEGSVSNTCKFCVGKCFRA